MAAAAVNLLSTRVPHGRVVTTWMTTSRPRCSCVPSSASVSASRSSTASPSRSGFLDSRRSAGGAANRAAAHWPMWASGGSETRLSAAQIVSSRSRRSISSASYRGAPRRSPVVEHQPHTRYLAPRNSVSACVRLAALSVVLGLGAVAHLLPVLGEQDQRRGVGSLQRGDQVSRTRPRSHGSNWSRSGSRTFTRSTR